MANITEKNPTSTLSRLNSIAATTVFIPPKLILPTSKLLVLQTDAVSLSSSSSDSSATSSSQLFGSVNLGLIKPSSYTSLKDLLPTSVVNSPTPTSAAAAHQSGQISIRNRLVKQAAGAYLQPMSTSSSSDAGSFFHRVWLKFSVEMSKNRLIRAVTRAFDWFLRVIRVRGSK